MGFLRPVRKVVDPKGQEWEIYVTRLELPRWRPADVDEPDATGWLWLDLLLLPLRLALFIVSDLLVPLVRAVFGVGRRRGRRGSARIVEAIAFAPVRESYSWRTSADHVDRVVAQIAEGLARGDVARPLGATFRGRSSR